MYERMLDKNREPRAEEIKEYIGEASWERLQCLEGRLVPYYQLSKQIRFPFGNRYGWCYKFNHKSAHLFHVFFEKGAFTVTIQIGDKQADNIESRLASLSEKARELWKNRYPCGDNGGWIHYRVLEDGDLEDVVNFIFTKRAPVIKG